MKTELTFNQLHTFALADIKANLVPALLGKAGIGKSSFLKTISNALNTKVFILSVNQLADRADLTGARMLQDSEGNYKQEFFPHATLQEAISYAKKHPDETPIIFLDEFNRTSPDVTSAIFTFITERRVGTIDFPDNIRFVVAGNDNGNVTSVDEASVTRLSVYHVKPDIKTFLNAQQNLNPYVHDVLMKNPELLDSETSSANDDDENDLRTLLLDDLDESAFSQKTRPRTITYVSEWLNNLGLVKTFEQAELDSLNELTNILHAVGNDNNSNKTLLLIGLEGHTGMTDFTQALYNHIVESYQSTVQIDEPNDDNNLPTLAKLKPSNEIVDALENASSKEDTEEIAQSILQDGGEEALCNAVLWAISKEAITEIQDVNTLRTFVTSALEISSSAPMESIRELAQLAPATEIITNVSAEIVRASNIGNTTAEKIVEAATMLGVVLQ